MDTDDVIAEPGENFEIINPSHTLAANARLVAAAPDLLAERDRLREALYECKEYAGTLRTQLAELRAERDLLRDAVLAIEGVVQKIVNTQGWREEEGSGDPGRLSVWMGPFLSEIQGHCSDALANTGKGGR
jgi:hypothetical protein